jgi:hypothetical protein
MFVNVSEGPHLSRERFVAHLLGDLDAVGLHSPVRMIGADTDIQMSFPLHQDELDLSARIIAADFDDGVSGQAARRHAIKSRNGEGPRDPELFQFTDVLLHGDGIAARPAGDHDLAHADA